MSPYPLLRHVTSLFVIGALGALASCGGSSQQPKKDAGQGGSGGGSGGAGGAGGGGGAGGSDAAIDTGADVPEDSGSPVDVPPMMPDAPMVTCPMTVNGVLEATDPTQAGRLSRINPTSTCGTTKAFPGTGADPSNPHVFDLYRFVNPSATSVCFTFTLTYATSPPPDGGAPDGGVAEGGAPDDAAAEAGTMEDGGVTDDGGASDGGVAEGGAPDGSPADAGADAPVQPMGFNDRYLVAYTSFDPTNIASGYLGDVGAVLTSPQTMSITVPANSSIDVVVYAIAATNSANPYTGPYTLSCTRP